MIIDDTYTIKIESKDGDVILNCADRPLNKVLDDQISIDGIENVNEKLKKSYELLVSSVISVEGLERKDGSQVSAEDLKSLAVPASFMNAFITAVKARNGEIEETKKN